jgi:hypothetical protein
MVLDPRGSQKSDLKAVLNHGSAFERYEGVEKYDCELVITLKLRHSISKDHLNRYFWYPKESSIGNANIISSEVISPNLEVSVSQKINTLQLQIEGLNYKLSEDQICTWIELYG